MLAARFQLDCEHCGEITEYRSWDHLLTEQQNSAMYCPKCGKVSRVEEVDGRYCPPVVSVN